MIKDAAAKLILVPLFGLSLAFCISFASTTHFRFPAGIWAYLFWVVITFFLWQSIVVMTAFIRNQNQIRKIIALKIFLLLMSSIAVAYVVTTLAVAFWAKLFQNPIAAPNTSYYAYSYLVIAPVISLSYEIVFLKKEQDLDSKIVAQLDLERQSAELQALTNELEPHFIFNALNVLSPLISSDAAKAQVFTIKLSQAYKYLLRNKHKERIALSEELRFIQDYFFLLQIRHPNKLRLNVELHDLPTDAVFILPFALQVLVENAIKHNQFSEEQPLQISITRCKHFIQVSNTVYPQLYAVTSTQVGLKNLSARYKLFCNKDILVDRKDDHFLVKLPLLKSMI